METLNREQIVEKLIDDDLDTILAHYDIGQISLMLRDGFVGYNNQSNEELILEYQERYGEPIYFKEEE